MTVIAYGMFILGIVLIGISVVFFFRFQCREAFLNLKKNKMIHEEKENHLVAQDVFYNNDELLSDKNVFIKDKRKPAQDDTSLLAEDIEKQKEIDFIEDDTEPLYKEEEDKTEELK